MPDPIFADPRLAALYDVLDDDRSDLDDLVSADASFDDLPAPIELDSDQESPSTVLARLRRS